ncbi:MAG: hypothetical protein GF309_13595 [Candidatus Lokiarchaeota archaeon]|nr:hypothetical protein [Candidatus Lokiarchaeota archaeon]
MSDGKAISLVEHLSPDWLATRVTVAAMGIFLPVYFFILMFVLPFQLQPFTDPTLNWLFHHLLVPALFCAPWVSFLYVNRYRLANTIHMTHETTTSVPLRWRIFYGMNAAFVVMFFVFPMVASPLAVIGGLFLSGTVIYRVAKGKLGKGKPAKLIAIILGFLLSILPIYVFLLFAPRYLEVWTAILSAWSSFWFGVVYGVAQCLVNVLSFGSPIHFMYFAANEFDKGVYGRSYTRTPTNKIRFGESILYIVFLILYLPPIPTPLGTIPFLNMSWLFKQYINWISMGVVGIMTLIKWRLDVGDEQTLGGPLNIIVVGMFLIVEIFFKTDLLVVTLVIWLAFIIFAALSAVAYASASPREMH